MSNRDQRLQDGLDSHLRMAIRDRMGRGESAVEAEANVRREFGNCGLIQEVTRDEWSWTWLEQLLRDICYGLRGMRRNPGFTAVAVLSLALGIGANTAIFSVIDNLMLRMLPVRDPAHLVLVQGTVYSNFFRSSIPFDSFPPAIYELFRDHNQVFTDIMAFGDLDRPEIKIDGQSEGFGEVQLVSGNFFSGLGVDAALGRLIDTNGADPVAVISYGNWKRRFALDPLVIGRKIAVNNVALQIVGVTPRRFFGVSPDAVPDVWAPLDLPGFVANPADDLVSFMARLKPGVTFQQAETALSVLYAQSPVEIQYVKGDSKTAVMHVLPGGQGYSNLREQFSRPLQILMIVVALVLLTACANVASLLLARAHARQTGIRTRLAIGAGRARLVRQLLTESLVLAAAGGAAGLALAMWGNSVLLGLLPEGPAPLRMHLDVRVLGFNAIATLLTVLLFGLAPALRGTCIEIRPSATPAGLRLHKILVASQVALSLFLLTAAGLFVGSLGKLKTMSLGFNPEKLVQVTLDTRGAGYHAGPPVVALYKQLIERFRTIPGVRAVSGVRNGLMRNGSTGTNISVPGSASRPDEGPLDSADVAPRFFETAGLPLISGRDIAVTDTADAPKVVVINESLAKRYFPGKDPVGLWLGTGPDGAAKFQIIGVARDARIVTLRRHIGPAMFFAALQGRTDRIGSIEIRTTADPASVIASARREVMAINPRLLFSVKTMDQQVDDLLTQERMIGKLSGFFGALALFLASIGLYGLMAYSVARRTREIGIRMAVGAERHNVLWMVLRETLALVAIGIAVGIPATFAGARLAGHWIEGLLYNMAATDPVTIAVAAALLLAVAVVAGYLPARRASRLDPMAALRYE